MHRLEAGKYLGQSGETVTLTTTTGGGGQISVTLDGQDMGPARQFQLPAAPGSRQLQIALAGPLNATCVVGIQQVDGGSDGDFLICQPLDPAPVHGYLFTAGPTGAVLLFAATKGSKKQTAKGNKVRKAAGKKGKGKVK